MAKSGKQKAREEKNAEHKVTRVPLPRGREILGIIEQRYGGNKMKVTCLDNKERVGRVPGRLKRHLWLRPGDIIIIEPWELDDGKGEILLKYKPNQVNWLKKNGYLEKDEEEF